MLNSQDNLRATRNSSKLISFRSQKEKYYCFIILNRASVDWKRISGELDFN